MDLKNKSDLADACQRALQTMAEGGERHSWRQNLENLLEWAQRASPDQRCTPEFQRRLWTDQAVSAITQHHFDVDGAIADPEFRHFVAGFWEHRLPEEREARVAALNQLFSECVERLEGLGGQGKQTVMALRVFATAFPLDFTTITQTRRLFLIYHALYDGRSPGVIECNRAVLDALTGALGAAGVDIPSTAERMMMPGVLFEDYLQDSAAAATEEVVSPGNVRLRPLPASRRRRGLLSMSGYLDSVAAMLEFVRDGCQREDLREHIRSINPTHKPSSVSTMMNALMGEWGAITANGDNLALTARADAYLDSGDPAEFADMLLTHVLGVDNVLWHLRERRELPRADIIDLLRIVNPGWTSNFAPTAMIRWLEELKLIAREGQGPYRLTKIGDTWAEQITWQPQTLISTPEVSPAKDPLPQQESDTCRLPKAEQIMAFVNERAVFAPEVVARLHYGLWSRPLRHFAVLAGLSGAGKTLLARSYGLALVAGQTQPESHLLTLPIQPGWYDPSALLGYVNPLNSDSYQRTAFLDFLLAAVQDPARPYTVVLDEMNLSHPEQYMAPLLSAMETGGAISLHSQGHDLEGVPPSIDYPANLVIIGTVNMDETTHALSDKVLDRAFVQEFWDVDVAGCPAWSGNGLPAEFKADVQSLLGDLVQALRPVRLHFGWRLIEDVIGFLDACHRGGSIALNDALDSAIFAKVLPKLRGEETPRLRKALEGVGARLEARGLQESATKVSDMIQDLQHTGSTRFWR
jgi:5-methylcytosine-specific restriction enzyme B